MASFLLPVVGASNGEVVAKARCLQLLLVLSDVPEQREEMLNAGAVKEVMNCMAACSDIEVLKNVCVFLRKLAQNHDQTKAKRVADHCVAQILEKALSRSACAELAVEALITLQVMVPLMTNCQAIIPSKKAVKRIVAAMDAHPKNIEMQRHACFSLVHILYNKQENQAEFKRCDAHKVVVKALQAYPEDLGMQLSGLWVAQRACTANRANQDKFASIGFPETILAAMAAFADDPQVQERACWAIRDFVADNQENGKLCEAAKVREALDKALARHPEATELKSAAAHALKELPDSV